VTEPSPPVQRGRASRLGASAVTWSVLAACVAVFLWQSATGGVNGSASLQLIFYPRLVVLEPWTVITSLFAHASVIHLAFNMYSLFALGPALEQALGHRRFAILYFLSGIGGSVGVLLLNAGPVLGASGAIFGLLGAYFVIARKMGGSSKQLILVIVLNLAIGFVIPNVAWQAHVGGLIVGSLVALVYLQPRSRLHPHRQGQLLAVIAAAVVIAGLAAIVLV
jgi:membrane associated rhomboid family serine protease